MKKQIPNIITLCNLTCGVLSTYHAVQGNLTIAAEFIALGIFFDFFDGLAARLLHVASDIGKELDSLADVVTSGVAPGFIIFHLLQSNHISWLKYVALLTPALAAYRLAKFNLDNRQHHGSFLGLPAPANALIWVGMALLYENSTTPATQPLFGSAGITVMAIVSVGTALLMVSEMPMFSLKFNFNELSWNTNRVRYLFLLGCLAVVVVSYSLHLPQACLTVVILWYILLSLFTQKKHPHE